jgi:glutamate racemase
MRLCSACTHYPIVRPLIERIVGPGVRVIDPAPASPDRWSVLLEYDGLGAAEQAASNGSMIWTSGDPDRAFAAMMDRLGCGRTAKCASQLGKEAELTLP